MQLWPAKEKPFAASVAAVPVGRVGADDHRRRVAELERHVLARRALLQLPADVAGARERQRGDALVVDEDVADLGRRAGDDVQPARPAAPRRA